MKAVVVAALALALCACAGNVVRQPDSSNPMATYFQPVTGRDGIVIRPPPADGKACVDTAPLNWRADPMRLVDPYVARGYVYLGFSLLTSPLPVDTRPAAVAHAKQLQAACVLLLPSVLGDAPTAGTESATARADAQTYTQGAAFFADTENERAFRPYGWSFSDLLPVQMRERNRRAGAFVRYLVAGSPAAQSNVQVGDIIIRFDGQPIANADALVAVTQALVEEDSVIVSVDRRGQEMEIPLTIVPATLPDMPAALASELRELRGLRDQRVLSLVEYRAKRTALLQKR